MRYLVILNDQYYPRHGTDDWRGTYATPEEARTRVDEWEAEDPYYTGYVVDLQEWVNRN